MLQHLSYRVSVKLPWIWARTLDGHFGGERNAFVRHAERAPNGRVLSSAISPMTRLPFKRRPPVLTKTTQCRADTPFCARRRRLARTSLHNIVNLIACSPQVSQFSLDPQVLGMSCV